MLLQIAGGMQTRHATAIVPTQIGTKVIITAISQVSPLRNRFAPANNITKTKADTLKSAANCTKSRNRVIGSRGVSDLLGLECFIGKFAGRFGTSRRGQGASIQKPTSTLTSMGRVRLSASK